MAAGDRGEWPVFSGKSEAAETIREGEIDKLRAKIGRLIVERDLSKASGR